MNSAPPAYRKLPGRGLGWAGISRVWLADDHILEVSSLLFTERYRRFILKDISAHIVRRTKVRLYWNLGYGIPGFGGAAVAGVLWAAGRTIADQDQRIGM